MQKTVYLPNQRLDSHRNSSRLDAEQSVGAMEDDQLGGTDGGSLESRVMARSYENCQLPSQRKPLLVLLNPHSGPGNAVRLYEERAAGVFAAAGLKSNVVITSHAGEASEIAERVKTDEYDTIVCVSGDGLPHEVINGLSRRQDATSALKHFAIAQLPGGSGNALSLSLNGGKNQWEAVAFGLVKGAPEPYDLMAISQVSPQGELSCYYSFLSQSFGIVADCDLGTEDLRWMGGARFTVGIVMKCLSGQKYPCKLAYHLHGDNNTGAGNTNDSLQPSITVNDDIPSDWKIESHPNLSMFYVGKMPWMSSDALVFPTSDPTDAAMDMLVWDTSNTGPLTALSHLLKFEKGTHVSKVPFYKKVDAFRLIPDSRDSYLSIDGESYPCTPIQVSVVPAAVRFVVPLAIH